MDSFEVAKIGGAVLSALLVIVGFRVMLEIAEEGRKAEPPGYTLPRAGSACRSPGGRARPLVPHRLRQLPARSIRPTSRRLLPARTRSRALQSSRSARRATRARRTAPTRSARICGASSGVPRPATRALAIRTP